MPCLREVRVTARVTVDISKAKGTLTGASFTYNGKAKKPVKSVALGKKALKAGTDYDVAYSGNVNAGTAKAKATGKAPTPARRAPSVEPTMTGRNAP